MTVENETNRDIAEMKIQKRRKGLSIEILDSKFTFDNKIIV